MSEVEQQSVEQLTQAITQVFLRVLALESILLEEKLISPETLAMAQVKAMEKLQQFQQVTGTNEKV